MSPRPAVVFLDAGNTVVEPEWPAIAAALARHGFIHSPDALRDAAGRARRLLDDFLAGRRSTESPGTKRLLTNLLLDRLGLPPGPAREAAEEDVAGILPGSWRAPMPGAAEALAALRRDGYRLALVSNSDGTVERLLVEAGLRAPFEAVFDSALVGAEKPDPEIFRFALRRMGVLAEQAVHVGDLPSVDVAGAVAAGVAAILLDPYDVFPDCPAPRLRALAELPGFLAGSGVRGATV